MKAKIKKLIEKRPRLRRKLKPEASLEQALQNIPRITNETVAEHREELLSSARKYIYPLKHSAHRVVIISAILVSAGIIVFFTYCLLALYKFHSTSTFIYRVTQVIPFPIAKAGPNFVSYENYLFEVRHYIHYYETQQKTNFETNGKQQLEAFRKQALDMVVEAAYVKQLAKEHNVSVSDKELSSTIQIVREQNRLGSNDQVFADVLKEFWGWSVGDFKRELRQQMLTQKVVAALDTDTQNQAQEAYSRILNGEDFAAMAKQYSQDAATRDAGGDYGASIDKSDRNLPPQLVDALFKLQPGQTSGIINTGATLEIVKLKEWDGQKARASHISFSFKPISTYTDPLKKKSAPRLLVKL